MSEGQGSISYGTQASNAGGGGGIVVAGARNGLTVDSGGFIVLGQDEGAAGDPGKLLNDRQVPMNGFALDFDQSATLRMTIEDGSLVGDQLSFLAASQSTSTPISLFTNQGIEPLPTTFGNFYLRLDQSFINTDGQADCVMSLGYNNNGVGGKVNPDEAFFLTALESHFIQPGQSVAQFEWYLESGTKNGDVNRHIFLIVDKDVGFANLNFQVDIINYQNTVQGGAGIWAQFSGSGLTMNGVTGQNLSLSMFGGNSSTDGELLFQVVGGSNGVATIQTSGGGTNESIGIVSPVIGIESNATAGLFPGITLQSNNPTAGSAAVLVEGFAVPIWEAWNDGYINQIPTFVASFISNASPIVPLGFIHLGFADGGPGHIPLVFSAGTLSATPPAGSFEFDSLTNCFFVSRLANNHEVLWMANSGAAAPATTATPVFTSFYGGNTKALGDPVGWADLNLGGTIWKVPLYQ